MTENQAKYRGLGRRMRSGVWAANAWSEEKLGGRRAHSQATDAVTSADSQGGGLGCVGSWAHGAARAGKRHTTQHLTDQSSGHRAHATKPTQRSNMFAILRLRYSRLIALAAAVLALTGASAGAVATHADAKPPQCWYHGWFYENGTWYNGWFLEDC